MKFSMERGTLLKAVSQAQSVVERRNTIPILANVLIEAEGDTVQFRATDLDIEVVDRAPAQVERAGATTVSAVTLHEIVRKLPDGALVTLSEDSASGRLTVEAGRSNFSLATLPKEDFPVMASSEYSANFSAPAPVLRRLFDKSKFAISTEETRYYLNGVYMHVSDGEDGKVLRCVATDGHRLARIDAPLPTGAADMPGVIVPRKTVGEMRKLLDDDDMQIAVSVSETKVRFATPDITLTSKVIDGTFPDYTRVIPQGNTRRLEVDAAEFAKAVDRVATVSSERSRAVKLQLDEDRLILSVNAPDSGAAEEELAVAYGDDRLEIGFNAKYLLEIASQVCVSDLTSRIFTDFAYDPHFTTVATPLAEVLEHKRGVCQDFAHLQVGCLRSIGIPAKYVSGYIETLPAPGEKKLVGADATHAWIAYFSPNEGWVEFDPTNDKPANSQHIVTALGRDYYDVTPVKGVIFGGGESPILSVSVDVSRL